MFFLADPNLKVGKFILRLRLAYALVYGTACMEKCTRLCRGAQEMYAHAGALRHMANSANRMGQPLRFVWLRACRKLVLYRGDWAFGRGLKAKARGVQLSEKAKALMELLGMET